MDKTTTQEKSHIQKKFCAFLFIILLVQPFLDNYFLYTDKASDLIGFSVPPLLTLLFAFGAAALYFIRSKGKGSGKILVLYGAAVAVYFALHHWNCLHFSSFWGKNFGYSLLHEAYYVARALIPALLLYLAYENHFSINDFLTAAWWMGVLVSGIVVISNILELGLCSYTNQPIAGGIQRWLFSAMESAPREYACKGFFSYANQVSVVMVGLLPMMVLQFIKKSTLWNGLAILLATVAMMMIGTMVACFGVLLALGGSLLVILFSAIVDPSTRKEWQTKPLQRLGTLLVIAVAVIVILPQCPAIMNMNVDGNNIAEKMSSLEEENEEEIDTEVVTDEERLALYSFIEYNYQEAGIADGFIHSRYSYKIDPEFWAWTIRNYSAGENMNYRSLESRIMQRVIAVNDQPLDSLFGISATREENICKVERDILAQYYSMGAIGVVLFFGAYFVTVIVTAAALLVILFKKKKFLWQETFVLMSLVLMLGCGYYCGNSLDQVFLSSVLGVLSGTLIYRDVSLLKELKKEKKENTEAAGEA